jgi:hypothetical protein
VYPCQNGGGNQLFSFTKQNELRNDHLCLLASSSSFNVEMKICTGEVNEKWSHIKSGFIKHTTTGKLIALIINFLNIFECYNYNKQILK